MVGTSVSSEMEKPFREKKRNFSFFREIMQNFGIGLVGKKGLQINLHLVSAILNLFLSLAMISKSLKDKIKPNLPSDQYSIMSFRSSIESP